MRAEFQFDNEDESGQQKWAELQGKVKMYLQKNVRSRSRHNTTQQSHAHTHTLERAASACAAGPSFTLVLRFFFFTSSCSCCVVVFVFQGAGNKKFSPAVVSVRTCLLRIVFAHVYPRLDVNVSKHLNHLLKSPFVVHPKTGKVCIPIDHTQADGFDCNTVPVSPTQQQQQQQSKLACKRVSID